ncbi:MAG: mechanosensitive ion channel family protein [Cyanobacteria bacterium P01_E01_bin.6]
MEQTQIMWAVALVVGCPAGTITLGEIVSRLRRNNNPLSEPLQIARVFVVPPLAILLVMLQLLHFSPSDIAIQVVATWLGIAVIYEVLSWINAVVVSGDRPYPWQIDVPNLLFQVARGFVVLSVASYLLATVWNVDLSKVFAALGVGSLVIALALQDTLSNLVSGFLLIFESPFKVGDWVRVKDLEGEVLEVNWRAVRLKTRERDVVIIPNGVLGKETIYNYTLLDPLHGDRVTFTFSNDEAPNRVIPVLKAAAIAVEGILHEPEPEVRPLQFTDYQAEYEVQYYIADFTHADTIQGQYITNVYYASKRHRLAKPVPSEKHYLLRHDTLDYENDLPDILNALVALPIFRTLDQDVLNILAHQAEVKYYGVGESVIQAGDFDAGICILLGGQVMLSAPSRDKPACLITYLETGDLFGEMALLRNEPSWVSVTVLQDVQVVVLSGDAVFSVAQQHSNFALEMNRFIEERKKMVQRATESGTLASAPQG